LRSMDTIDTYGVEMLTELCSVQPLDHHLSAMHSALCILHCALTT
jgi:hypothetical protein